MPEIPPEILHHMMETKESLGRIEANQATTTSFLRGVNSKVDEHIKDKGAHGQAERDENEQKSDRWWNTWGTKIMAGTALFDIIWHFFHKGPKGP